MRLMTFDRSTHDFAGYYAPEKLGRSRRMTPEGFLVLEGTPIARTGTQLYSTSELPFAGDAHGMIRVDRPENEVFHPNTLASFEGKAVTVGHPPEGVDVSNWKAKSVGHVQNVRRGTGVEADLLIGDLVIKDRDAISYVNKRLPQVSAGYSAEYEETGRGSASQNTIIGNHVALVEQGRAGPRVAVRDSHFGAHMKTRTRDAVLNAIPPGKCLALGAVWRGDLKPIVDSYVDNLPGLNTPLTPPNILSAEPTNPTLDLGRQWVGGLIERIGNSTHTEPTGASDEVDLTNVAGEVKGLYSALNTEPVNMNAVQDAARRVRRASDAVRMRLVGDSGIRGINQRSYAMVRQLNINSRQYQADRAEKMARASQPHDHRAGLVRAAGMPGNTPAELNQRARAYWAANR